jgi:hypothetical protein
VKAEEAQELLPGQTTSDATILQPNSPGWIESQKLDTLRDKIYEHIFSTYDGTGKSIYDEAG